VVDWDGGASACGIPHYRESNCSLATALDGRIRRRGIIGSVRP